jgi:hypothetical protein
VSDRLGKITEEARDRMRTIPRWKQRRDALLECIEEKHRPKPVYPDPDDDADDASTKRRSLL